MRDIAICLVVFGSLPFIFTRPWLGALMWVWLSVMNPHRLSWGFAYDLQFAQYVAIVTLISLFVKQGRLRVPWSPPVVLLLMFVVWMNVTTVFALFPEQSLPHWSFVMKIMLMTFVGMIALNEKRHINWLVWTLGLSLAFYGVKGGLFTLRGGGAERVWGPEGSIIEDNNALAVALVMIIPLLWYMRTYATRNWLRWSLAGVIGLCAVSALGSYSRSALIAIGAMAGFLWLKSRNKLMLGVMIMLLSPAIVMVMPDKWFDRMDTIVNFEQDGSAMGRINAWNMAFNLAKDRPIVGGGFEIYVPSVFARYAPNPDDLHAAHSIYFAALGEHGFVGLALFLGLLVATWRTGSWIVRRSSGIPELRWAADLALMSQVAMVGYAVGGAFLSLLYYDAFYYIVVILVLVRRQVEQTLAKEVVGMQKLPVNAIAALPVNPPHPHSG